MEADLARRGLMAAIKLFNYLNRFNALLTMESKARRLGYQGGASATVQSTKDYG